jgi:flagellar motor protein MotB
MTLSQRRANSVRDYLAGKFGIDRSRLQSVGRGEAQLLNPAAPNDRTNRRVEVMNLGS